jgi:hypothetical protein
MLKLLHPDPSKHLIWAILQHDIPERYIGDIPAPSKWAGTIHIEHEKELENNILDNIFTYDENHYGNMSIGDMSWLKGLDMLELYLWCKDQISLGNNRATLMLHRIENFFMDNGAKFPHQVYAMFTDARYDTEWTTTGELDDFQS